MPHPIAYLGDTSLQTAAAYLGGLLTHWGWAFDYVQSQQAVDARFFDSPRELVIVSDYPAAMMPAAAQRRLLEMIRGGCGLIMIGGWESFHGSGGNWDGLPLAEALPVAIEAGDDRVNCDQPTLVRCVVGQESHPAVTDLPWQERPPVIGGFNRIAAMPGSTTLLEAQRFRAEFCGGEFRFAAAECHPLLIVGEFGAGHTAALATDVAPHWVGGLVDWGDGRVAAQAPGGEAIEVGDLYAAFLRRLLAWVCKR